MSVKRIFLTVILVLLVNFSTSFGATAQENFEDFLHYAMIGRFEMAQSYAQDLIDSEPDPLELLSITEDNPRAYDLLVKLFNDCEQLKDEAGAVMDIIEQGRFIRRTDPVIIKQEIERLSTTVRGRLSAEKRLKNAGEYAIPFMLDTLADSSRKNEFPYVTVAMGKMGRDAIAPLVAALQMDDVALKAEVIRALGSISYPQALPYLKYIYETTDSEQLKDLAKQNICKIDTSAIKVPATRLFMDLADKYYYHMDSVAAPADYDFANIWFWDADLNRIQREKVSKDYYFELMAMRSCEWSLKADPANSEAIALWIASFFSAEKTGIEMPAYFGENHAQAITYAITAGPEYLHRALARALKDKNDYVALNVVEALAVNAGEASLLYSYGANQPLVEALNYRTLPVRYSSAIAIAAANPSCEFIGSKLIIKNLSDAVVEKGKDQLGEELSRAYSLRSLNVLRDLAIANNKRVDVSKALGSLITVVKSDDFDKRVIAGDILSKIDSPDAQRALAQIALDDQESMDVRHSMFVALIKSAKNFGQMLSNEQIDQIYELASSVDTDPQIRVDAAGAYGSLNLPSQKVKELILDQAKS